jgi:glycosyltransferase involved in cell wall biosynthesis
VKIAIIYFRDIKTWTTGDGVYLKNLAIALSNRGHEISSLYLWPTTFTKTSLWYERYRRTIYSAYLMKIAFRLKRYDIIVFAEPFYPQNLLLLTLFRLLCKSPVVIFCGIGAPFKRIKAYYFLVKKKFPAMISGEKARPLAAEISRIVGLVPPGLDLAGFYPQNIRKCYDLLYLGHIFREKGIFLLLEAMKCLKADGFKPHLKIIHTPGPEENSIKRYIRENRLDNIDMESKILERPAIEYNKARVFVYPGISHKRVATVPLTILEASACGLPVVCTSLYRYIDLPNATITEPEPKALAQAIRETLNNDNQANCQRTQEIMRGRYSLESMGIFAEDFFSKLLHVPNK